MNYLDIKSSLANLSKQSLVCVFSVALGLMILLLFSGGFNSTICFLIGIAILVVAFIVFVKDHFKNISVASLTLIFLSVIFFISSIINSLVCTSIISSILPVSLLGFSMILSMSNNDEKNLLTRLISIIGLASSIFGICLFFLPIEVLGGVYEGRLMFPFQYANSSGI